MKYLRQVDGLFGRVGSIRIDKKFHAIADGLARKLHPAGVILWMGSHLHLDEGESFFGPPPKLRFQLAVIVGGEATAAVCGNGFARCAEQLDEGNMKQLRP